MALGFMTISTEASTEKPEVHGPLRPYPLRGKGDYPLQGKSSDYTLRAKGEGNYPLRGKGDVSRFDAVKKNPPKISRPTCNKFPRICRGKGSPGPDCCKKMCVNVMFDRLNCGMCGNKCKYGQICCGGSCVNPLWDRRHCGGCNIKCKKGDTCVYGMCNYGY
ncbi:Stigma-specific protein Stig1 [Macleaya cordata]|uniref:Stigma-specific protein Stig1 n=1 Tax=Macleaya cordata TaxID=56857 RepID=A0A200QE74_MACCD|nr:Stigma-specific protein Stig1 [Macleaya cordata]OVA09767.1 Stigma-specific protein Stig1 [Macleaya cordata]